MLFVADRLCTPSLCPKFTYFSHNLNWLICQGKTWQLLLLFSWLSLEVSSYFWKTITKSNPRSFDWKAFLPNAISFTFLPHLIYFSWRSQNSPIKINFLFFGPSFLFPVPVDEINQSSWSNIEKYRSSHSWRHHLPPSRIKFGGIFVYKQILSPRSFQRTLNFFAPRDVIAALKSFFFSFHFMLSAKRSKFRKK